MARKTKTQIAAEAIANGCPKSRLNGTATEVKQVADAWDDAIMEAGADTAAAVSGKNAHKGHHSVTKPAAVVVGIAKFLLG